MERTGTVDYSKGLIYKLCCKDPNITDIYIGSTTNMRHRKCTHKYSCNTPTGKNYNLKVYQFIRNNGGFDNWNIILVEYVNCNSKQELEKEERVVIQLLKPTLNNRIPTRTITEYQEEHKEELDDYYKKYRKQNKEKIKKKNKQYYQNNKEQLGVKVKCEFCEALITIRCLKKHQKRNICKKFQIIED